LNVEFSETCYAASRKEAAAFLAASLAGGPMNVVMIVLIRM